MEKFDVLVIGSGSGMIVAASAVGSGLKTALIESGPMGGTCINRGCVPSKMLIHPADVAVMISEAEKVGVRASVNSIDFGNIMTRMHELVTEDVERQARAVETDPKIRWFKDAAEFVSDYTLKTGDHIVKADKIFIVSGARPDVGQLLRAPGHSFAGGAAAIRAGPLHPIQDYEGRCPIANHVCFIFL